MQVLCQLLLYNFYITGVYDSLYCAVHPMKYLESDVMLYKWLKLSVASRPHPATASSGKLGRSKVSHEWRQRFIIVEFPH